MENKEKRRHHRLDLKLEVCCRQIGAGGKVFRPAKAVNISTGGVLIESEHFDHADHGQLFNLELDVPSDEKILEFNKRFSGFARVVRIMELQSEKKHVALEFCTSPKLDI